MSDVQKTRVNRDDELALFELIATGGTPKRVLLVSAAGGIGKTDLLREIGCRRPKAALYGVLDFKNRDVPDLAELFSRLCARLDWTHFPCLSTQIAEFNKPTVNISENTIIGRAAISIALSAPDQELRKFRRAALTDAFLDDLRAAGPVILVFDTFNDCDPELAQWVSGFIARACDTSTLTVIVAGKSVPEPTLEWEAHCHTLELGPMAAEHWLQYAEAIGLVVTLDYIRGCWGCYKGNSLAMANHIEALVREGIE